MLVENNASNIQSSLNIIYQWFRTKISKSPNGQFCERKTWKTCHIIILLREAV